MYVRKTVDTAFGDYPSITKEVRGAVVESGAWEGYCVVSLEGALAGLGIISFWDKRGLDNLVDEIGRNLPARVDYHSQTSPFDVSGNVKGAVVGGSVMLLAHEGKPVFGSSQGLVLLEFDGSRRGIYHIQVVEAGLELDSYQVETCHMGVHDITDEMRRSVAKNRVRNDIYHITQFHSMAGLLLCSKEEGVRRDITEDIKQLMPTRADFGHRETAADAGGHVKTTITNNQLSPVVEDGELALGEGRAVVLAEYDGPRPRTFYVDVIHGQIDRERDEKMERLKYNSQLCRQCFSIPATCQEQAAGVVKGVAGSMPTEALKGIRWVIVTDRGDSCLAGVISIPAFGRYAGAFAFQFTTVWCIEAVRYMEIEERQAARTLLVEVSASDGPTRLMGALRSARRKGCHTVVTTSHTDSPRIREAGCLLIVNTSDSLESGPGLRNYYASVLGLFRLATAMGEVRGTCPESATARLMEGVRELAREYGERLKEIDGQMFMPAGRQKEYRVVETMGDSTSFATSYFVGVEYVEAAGVMASTTSMGDWCHVNYFERDPELLRVIVAARGGGPNQSHVLETISQAEGVGRPVLLVTDELKEEYGAKGRVEVCMVPKAPAGYEFLAPFLDYLPGTLLAIYVTACQEEPHFRGTDSRRKQSEVGCTIKDSEIWVGWKAGRIREKVPLCKPRMGEITDTVMTAIVCSGMREGVCIVTALDDKAIVVMTNRGKADIRQDIMEDLGRMVPTRVNRWGWMAGEVSGGIAEVTKVALSVVARTKTAATGGSLDVIIHEGMPLLAPDQGISAVDYRDGEEVEPTIFCG